MAHIYQERRCINSLAPLPVQREADCEATCRMCRPIRVRHDMRPRLTIRYPRQSDCTLYALSSLVSSGIWANETHRARSAGY